MFMVLFTHRLPILFTYVHGFVCTHMMIYMYMYIYIYTYGVTTVWMFHVIPILNSCGYSSANPHKIRYFIGHLIGLPVKAFAKIQLSIIYSPLTSVLEPIFSRVIPIKEKRPWSGGRPKKIHCMKTRNTKSISQRIFMGGKVAVLAPHLVLSTLITFWAQPQSVSAPEPLAVKDTVSIHIHEDRRTHQRYLGVS